VDIGKVTEKALVDKKDFQVFYDETVSSVVCYARCLCRNNVEAGDIVHDSYLSAMKQWDSFSGRGTRKAWLIGIVRNTYLSWLRRRKIRKMVSFELVSDSIAAEKTTPQSDRGCVWEAIEKLEKNHKEIIYLRFAGGLSYAELAEALKIPTGTVRSRLYRALKELKERLGSYYDK